MELSVFYFNHINFTFEPHLETFFIQVAVHIINIFLAPKHGGMWEDTTETINIFLPPKYNRNYSLTFFQLQSEKVQQNLFIDAYEDEKKRIQYEHDQREQELSLLLQEREMRFSKAYALTTR